jgi:drug/metabolite transporter (DMT)-like permease
MFVRGDSNPKFRPLWPGVPLALASAVLFGASTPIAKLLLGDAVSPWLLAGLLYLGSGIGLGLIQVVRLALGRSSTEASLHRQDVPWLMLVVLFGGILGPLLLMVGLRSTAASTASLLLNLEAVATMAIAWVVFRENVDRRLMVGAAAIVGAAVLLSWSNGQAGFGFGALAIAGACAAWGIDNNLTRKLSAADPLQIAMTKGLVAGTINLILALSVGARLPNWSLASGAAIVGFFGYGISLSLFVLGLRYLGAARTGAYFSTAPFVGALISIPLFGDAITARLVVAGLLMAAGVYLHLTERHEHEHAHEAMDHEHRHVHDAHHQHEHGPDDPPGEPHAHPHRHAPLRHAHPHYPDLHHRHGHG